MSAPVTLDRAAFRDWLLSLPPQHRTGRGGFSDACPLAAFLRSRGGKFPRVYCDVFYPDREWIGQRGSPLPMWALRFRQTVDWGTETHVTAAEALRILEAIPDA